MNDAKRYTYIVKNELTKEAKIVSEYYKSNKKKEIILSSDLPLVPYFTDYELSKDEKKIILTTEKVEIYRRSIKAIYWVYNTVNSSIQMVFNEKIQEPSFSPDGNKVAFIYKRNIYVKNLIDDSVSRITNDGNNEIINGITDWVYEEEFGFVRAFLWSPDSSKLVFLRFDESKVPLFSMDIYGKGLYQFPYKFRYPKAGESNSKVSLHLYDFASKATSQIQFSNNSKPYYIPRFKFTKDQNILSVQTINREQNHLRLHLVDVILKRSKLILEEKSEEYLDVNDNLIFLSDKSFLWTSEKSGFNHIYHYNKKGKLINQVTRGSWEVENINAFNHKTNQIIFGAAMKSSIDRGLYSVGLRDRKIKPITKESGFNQAVFNLEGNIFIHSYSDKNTPPKYVIRSVEDVSLRRTILDNQELKNKLSKYKLPEKIFDTIRLNGQAMNYYIIKPDDFDSLKKYPLLLFQYSGPGSQQVSNRWGNNKDLWHKMLTQYGYFIACLDGRGTGYKGEKFKKMTYMNLGKLETQDQISFAKRISLLPYIDDNRTGIWGWSYGGYISTNSLLKGNEVFEMAIAVAPVTSWRFYDTIYTERFMKTPQENSDGYYDNSPINYVERLKGKYLLIHGSGDDNVHVQNSMRLIDAIIENGKQFEWMIYPDKKHGISGLNAQNHLYTKMTNFIKNNL
tara:strand:- start:20308 stop:22341 length:2034 start_codon:yes stop_codon:yes gene_type:complete